MKETEAPVQAFSLPILRPELLKHDRGVAKLKPAPANSPVRMVFGAVGNPAVLHFDPSPST